MTDATEQAMVDAVVIRRLREQNAELLAALEVTTTRLVKMHLGPNWKPEIHGDFNCGVCFDIDSARAAIARATDLDTTTNPQAWRRAGHTCERETLDGASGCPHPSHAPAQEDTE